MNDPCRAFYVSEKKLSAKNERLQRENRDRMISDVSGSRRRSIDEILQEVLRKSKKRSLRKNCIVFISFNRKARKGVQDEEVEGGHEEDRTRNEKKVSQQQNL